MFYISINNLIEYTTFNVALLLEIIFQGPGLAEEPGIAHMGGKTSTRLVDSCGMYLEADEMSIYEAWIRGNKQVTTRTTVFVN